LTQILQSRLTQIIDLTQILRLTTNPLTTNPRPATRQLVPAIRRAFKGALMLNSDYLLDDASLALRVGEADAIAFGRPFLANPDLPARFAKRTPLNPANATTFYTPGPVGYTDYPTYAGG
jgi:N-ethylmaleimide reductase